MSFPFQRAGLVAHGNVTNWNNDSRAHHGSYDKHGDVSQLRAMFDDIVALFDAPARYRAALADPLYNTITPVRVVPEIVNVTRGQYTELVLAVLGRRARVVEIDGPTGCGKSTYALMALQEAYCRTLCIVCPTDANVANVLYEFNEAIPRRLWSLGYGMASWHPATFVDFNTFTPEPHSILVTSAVRLSEYVIHRRRWPPVDDLCIDEYHLKIPEMIFLRHLCLTCEFPGTVLFCSATPDGRVAPTPDIGVHRHDRVALPDPLSPEGVQRSSPRSYRGFGAGSVGTIVANCDLAHELAAQLRAERVTTHLLCRHTNVAAAQVAFAETSTCAYVMTPDVEAGITLRMAVFVDYGDREQKVFRNGVQYVDIVPLDPSQAVQRKGRANRVVPTYIVSNAAAALGTSSDYTILYSESAIKCMAFGVAVADLAVWSSCVTRFPRLASMTSTAAHLCAVSPEPLATMFTRDDAGVLYAEFGGSSTSFVNDNLSSFLQFRWPAGFAFYPYFDLTKNMDLSVVATASVTNAITQAFIANSTSPAPTVTGALPDVKAHPGVYVSTVFATLSTMFAGAENLSAARFNTEAEARAFDPTYPLTNIMSDEAAELVSACRSAGLLFDTSHVAVIAPGGISRMHAGFQPSLSQWSVARKRIFRFNNQSFEVNTGRMLGPDSKPDKPLIDAELVRALHPLLTAAQIANDPARTVELSTHRRRQARCGNAWFKALSL